MSLFYKTSCKIWKCYWSGKEIVTPPILVFCSDFFPWHVWRKKVDLWFWVFPQVAEVGKTEKNIILRLRQRRSLKKCFSQFFLLRELGEKLKIRGQLFFWRNVSGKKIRTECFFHFSQYFRENSYSSKNMFFFHLFGFFIEFDN